jgi:malate dehydrogenase (oxaloacetate-decarboxylating)
MPVGTYELVQSADGYVARIHARGAAVLTTPRINRGTAFTLEERRELGLTGLLPSGVSTLDRQVRRTYAQYHSQASDLAKWVYLANLRDRNEVLFYRLLSEHIEEMLPVVYTPTVGLAIERFSHEFRRSRGVYLSVDRPDEVEIALRNTELGAEDVDLLVATDAEGILGIGDQGVGGIEIAVGKLAVYTAAAGIHPSRVLPVMLDMGTDNLTLLNDEMYLGERHARVRDERYDQLIDAYVTAVAKLFPNAMLHWEDFGASNARRILDRYASDYCTFNDDMQGTAAVVLAAAFSAVRAADTRLRDQRVVIHGAGTAGLGVADILRDQMVREGLSLEEATGRFWALARTGSSPTTASSTSATFRCPTPAPGPRSPTGPRQGRGRVWPTWSAGYSRQCSSAPRPRQGRSPSRSCGMWPPTARGRSSCRCPIPPPRPRRCPRTCCAGPTAAPWWQPGARSRRSCTTTSPTRSPRPTTHSSSPASGSA